jgi:hypothetical protein
LRGKCRQDQRFEFVRIRPAIEEQRLLYATILNVLAGVVTGSVFKIRAILVLLFFVMIESIILCFFQGATALLWAFANVAGIEFGYLTGMFARSVVERVANSRANARTGRIP